MKKIGIAIPFMISLAVTVALSAPIATTTIVPSLQDADRIPIGRPGGTVAYTTTPSQILAGYRAYSTAQTTRNATYQSKSGFTGYTTTARVTRTAFGAYTTGRVKIGKFTNLSSSKVITIGNHGLYMNGIQVVTW